ncbi:hypothetical protein [Yinghuangia sp. YIM S09857]|uniref:hypothetical protein n=1 Tax=Yinghuangia sp. YIM S09857 TaxID=3436929 RepID=UPI003F5325E1
MRDEQAPEIDELELAAELVRHAALASELDPLLEERVVAPAMRRRRRRVRLGIGVAAALTASSVVVAVAMLGPSETTGSAAPGSTGAPVVPSANGTFAVSPPGTLPQSDLALRDLAQAAERVGTSTQADVYTNVRSDPCRCSITVYLSDLTRSEAFLADLRAAFPDAAADLRVNFAPGKYARAACNAIFALMSTELKERQLPFQVNTTAVAVDCSVFLVGVDAVETARAYLADPANGFNAREMAVEVRYTGDQSFMGAPPPTG